jgi:methyl-accepting chemotaxis protein
MKWPWTRHAEATLPPLETAHAIDEACSLRDAVQARVNEVVSMTEREVLATGRCVNRIVDLATDQIAELRQLVTASQDERSQLVSRQQMESTQQFVGLLHSELDQQRQYAEESRHQGEQIAAAAKRVSGLSQQARVLAMNARIEAAHAGKNGAALAVIAAEMKRLADEIALANSSIQSLAVSVGELVPKLSATVDEMKARTTEFSEDLDGRLQFMEQQRQQVHYVAQRGLETSDKTMKEILHSSHEALSHLQFQDPVAQGLMRIDRRLRDHQLALCETLRVDQSHWSFSAPMHVEIGGEKQVDAENAGEVLLF